ncbi:hypothetical protein [Salsuginibacillus kocurii]|uniref:hypothetical protein n=1 Tax=Salsuginibacillus kocurii TaxID=427078 RepID=UPI000370AA5D|nr:hypothetical protein [Salsuginibacillus kocurii]
MMNEQQLKMLNEEVERTEGILRLAPTWVPRAFMVPGRRLKLHPDDLYAFGKERGGINERWFASTTPADNGPDAEADEGLSYIAIPDGDNYQYALFKDAIASLGEKWLGKEVMDKHGGWTVLTKFFDNKGPIPFHIHQREQHAKDVNKKGKSEAYYFPPAYNQIEQTFPYTFFGLDPSTTKEDIKTCLQAWEKGDNQILAHSHAYRLEPGTGWDVPAGILHAPGSLVTYELQNNEDIFGMYQSVVEDRPVPRDLLVKDVPVDKAYDFDYLIDIIDWEANTNPSFKKDHFRPPVPVQSETEHSQASQGEEAWVVYGTSNYSAKQVTVYPQSTYTLYENEAFGFISMQGRGFIGKQRVETPIMLRFGDMSADEGFVIKNRAKLGVELYNDSMVEPLVLLLHFGPDA